MYDDDESIRKKIKERYQCRLTNLIYDIDEVKYNKAQTVTSLEERWKGCFGLFLKIWLEHGILFSSNLSVSLIC